MRRPEAAAPGLQGGVEVGVVAHRGRAAGGLAGGRYVTIFLGAVGPPGRLGVAAAAAQGDAPGWFTSGSAVVIAAPKDMLQETCFQSVAAVRVGRRAG